MAGGGPKVKGGTKVLETLRSISRAIGKSSVVQVGFLENATYPNGTPVAMVAAIQDFGAPKVGIPPRPFFRNAIARNRDMWPKVLEAALKASEFRTDKALRMLGEHIRGDIQRSIIETNTPPLSPATVARRLARYKNKKKKTSGGSGIDKPLIDTGHMINSVDYRVK